MNCESAIIWQNREHSDLTDTDKSDLLQLFENAIALNVSIHELVWEVTDQVHKLLGYDDCVLYLYDEDKECLMQMAALGEKKVNNQHIVAPIRIQPGEGVVGRVFLSGIARILGDTSLDGNYIIDDRFRLSEISIPIVSNGEVIGVIDSEHPTENFYTDNDRLILIEMAELIAAKIESF